MDDYGRALLIDAVTVIFCVALLLRYGDLRFSHPATPYVVFHIHTVTVRLAGLLGGASTLFSDGYGFFEPVMPGEIVRAAFYCDLAFWSVTAVWIFFKNIAGPERPPRTEVMRLNPRILRPVLLGAFLLGIVGLRIATTIPGVESYQGLSLSDEWSNSSYLVILPGWFGLAVLGYIYYYGFGRISGLLLTGYVVLMSLQGIFRFRVVITLLLAVTIWVERRNRRWPSKTIVLGLVLLAAAFFPMKIVGNMVQRGESVSDMSRAFSASVSEATEGSAPDHMFLDEFASALTLLDLHGHKYFGSIYLPLLTLPIPRAMWPEKPGLADFLKDISTENRPMAASGMITTYLGESYANFGLAGIFLVPPLLAILLTIFYRKAHTTPYDSVLRFSYILVSVNLVEVYRDGLISIVTYTFVSMMPLVILVLAHVATNLVRKHRRIVLKNFADPTSTDPTAHARS